MSTPSPNPQSYNPTELSRVLAYSESVLEQAKARLSNLKILTLANMSLIEGICSQTLANEVDVSLLRYINTPGIDSETVKKNPLLKEALLIAAAKTNCKTTIGKVVGFITNQNGVSLSIYNKAIKTADERGDYESYITLIAALERPETPVNLELE